MLLAIEQRAPDTFERAALRWLAGLCPKSRRVCLEDAVVAAAALEQLPALGALQTLAALCQRLGERAAAVFAGPLSRWQAEHVLAGIAARMNEVGSGFTRRNADRLLQGRSAPGRAQHTTFTFLGYAFRARGRAALMAGTSPAS